MSPQDETAAMAEPLTSAQVAPGNSSDEVEVPAPKPTRRQGRVVAVITGCAALATLAAATALYRRAGESRLAAAPLAKHLNKLYQDANWANGGSQGSCNCDCSWANGGAQGSCSPTARDDQPCWRCCCRNFIGEGGYEGDRSDDRFDNDPVHHGDRFDDRFDDDRFDDDRLDGDRSEGRYTGSGLGDYGGNRGSGHPFPGWEGGEGEDFECEDFEEGEWVRVKNGIGEEDFRDAQIVERRRQSMYEVRFHGGFRKTVSCHRLEEAAHPLWQSFISFVLFLLFLCCCVGIVMGVIQFINKDKRKPMIALPVMAEEPAPNRSCY